MLARALLDVINFTSAWRRASNITFLLSLYIFNSVIVRPQFFLLFVLSLLPHDLKRVSSFVSIQLRRHLALSRSKWRTRKKIKITKFSIRQLHPRQRLMKLREAERKCRRRRALMQTSGVVTVDCGRHCLLPQLLKYTMLHWKSTSIIHSSFSPNKLYAVCRLSINFKIYAIATVDGARDWSIIRERRCCLFTGL